MKDPKNLVFNKLKTGCPSVGISNLQDFCKFQTSPHKYVYCVEHNCPIFFWVSEMIEALIVAGYIDSIKDAATEAAQKYYYGALEKAKRG